MKYLYKNEDDFTVERKLGYTWYYCGVLKSAIEKYALSENPDYDELDRIVRRINIYMNSSRFDGALGSPIYVETTYASDVGQIRAALLKMDRKNMSKEEIREFYKIQIERIDYAPERNESLLWSS